MPRWGAVKAPPPTTTSYQVQGTQHGSPSRCGRRDVPRAFEKRNACIRACPVVEWSCSPIAWPSMLVLWSHMGSSSADGTGPRLPSFSSPS
jgi:hypothetical protein